MSRMGQFFGKLFASGSGRQEAVLRAYGKLPMYAEYRRLEVSPGAPTAFTEWLDEGRLAWVRGTGDGQRGSIRHSHLVLRQQREWIVASVWDSRDSLGRLAPFSFFVACPPDALGDDWLQRYAAAFVLHQYFDQLYGGLSSVGHGTDFYRLYQKRALPLRPDDLARRSEDLRQRAQQITAATFTPSLESIAGGAGVWFASLLEHARRWRSEAAALAELAVACPVTRSPEPAVQAVFWLHWLQSLRKSPDPAPNLILPCDGGLARRVYLLVRDPLPGDFQLLTTDAAGYRYVQDLGAKAGADPADSAAPSGAAVPAAGAEATTAGDTTSVSSQVPPETTPAAVPVGSLLEALMRMQNAGSHAATAPPGAGA